jgi:hypothetical protein
LGTLWIHLWLLPVLVADLVTIETDAADPQLGRIAVASCSATLGAGQCRSADEPGADPTWFVRVSWQGAAQLRARIEIRRAGEAAPESVRVVEFSAADDLPQRNRAIGLIVAAYVIEQLPSARPPEPRPPPPSPPPPPVPAPPPADRAEDQAVEEEEAHEAEADEEEDEEASEAEEEFESDVPEPPLRMPAWCADLAVLAAPGLDRGPPRLGLVLRGLVRPFDLPLSGLLALRAARRFENPELLWLGGGAGLALRLRGPVRPLAFELRGEFALEHVQVDASDALSDRQQSDETVRYGARVGLDAHLTLVGRLGLVAGAELSAMTPTLYLHIGGDPVRQDRAIGWGGLLGVRLTD